MKYINSKKKEYKNKNHEFPKQLNFKVSYSTRFELFFYDQSAVLLNGQLHYGVEIFSVYVCSKCACVYLSTISTTLKVHQSKKKHLYN